MINFVLWMVIVFCVLGTITNLLEIRVYLKKIKTLDAQLKKLESGDE